MIKIYSIKEDAPLFSLNFLGIKVGMTLRNVLYVSVISGLPTLFFLGSLFTQQKYILFSIIWLISLIFSYGLSTYRIDNVPIDVYVKNWWLYQSFKNKIEINEIEEIKKGKDFKDLVKEKKELILKKI